MKTITAESPERNLPKLSGRGQSGCAIYDRKLIFTLLALFRKSKTNTT